MSSGWVAAVCSCTLGSRSGLTTSLCLRLVVTRYLFVRCDNAPAPWTSDDTGDTVRLSVPDLAAKEIKQAQGQVFEMADNPYW